MNFSKAYMLKQILSKDMYSKKELNNLLSNKADLVNGTIPLAQIPETSGRNSDLIDYLISVMTSMNPDTSITTLNSTVDATGSTTHENAASYINIPSSIGFQPETDGIIVTYSNDTIITEDFYTCSSDGNSGYNLTFTEAAYQNFKANEDISVIIFKKSYITSQTVRNIWSGNEETYEHLTPDSNTLYFILGASS